MMVTMFDEYQGLTADMVRNYLAATGWHLKDWDYYKDWHLADCAGPPCIAIYDSSSDGMHQLNPEHALLAISKQERRTPQGLLREINPRMRKGVPSKAALRAHRGLWLRSIGTETIATVLSRLIDEFPSPRDNESYFWPCDANGNKVRWPEKDGVML